MASNRKQTARKAAPAKATSRPRAKQTIEDLEVPKADADVRGGVTTVPTMATKTLLTGPYDDILRGVYTTSYEQDDDPPK